MDRRRRLRPWPVTTVRTTPVVTGQYPVRIIGPTLMATPATER